MTTHRHHQHRRAGHQRPRRPTTCSARSTDAALVVEGGQVAWVGPAADAPAADERVDAGGRAVLPGFVDSHSHLVFAGDRAQEFAARMAGEPYAAGGIRTTVAATRAATDEQLTSHVARLVAEMRRQGTTTVEIKSGYGLTVHDEARSLAVARQFTDETTFLGAHVVPAEYADDPAAYVDLVTGPMLEAAAPHARWIDVFCERGAFDGDQARAVLDGRRRGRAAGPAARQPARPGPGRPARRRARPRRGRPLHLPRRRRRRRARDSRHRSRRCCRAWSSRTRQPYPDARRLLDAGVAVALASDCNPGSCFTSSMPLCIALAVREMGMTPAEARARGDRTAAPGRSAATTSGVLAPGTRADLVLLDAPSHVHLAYRPGVPLVAGDLGQAAGRSEAAAPAARLRYPPRPGAEIRHLPDVRAYLRRANLDLTERPDRGDDQHVRDHQDLPRLPSSTTAASGCRAAAPRVAPSAGSRAAARLGAGAARTPAHAADARDANSAARDVGGPRHDGRRGSTHEPDPGRTRRRADGARVAGSASVVRRGRRPDRRHRACCSSGDAGVGKTRLLTELRDLAVAEGWQVVAGHCLDFGDSALPYLPFSEVLGRLAADLPEVVDAVAGAHPALAGSSPAAACCAPPRRGDGVRARPRRPVRGRARRCSRRPPPRRPLLLVIEDAHWADQSTRDLLSFLFSRPFAGPVAVVASYRSDDLHRRHPLRRQVAEWSRLARRRPARSSRR